LVSDEQIIERVLRGSAEDYRELMLRHQDALFRLSYRMLGRREDAEDVVQDAFLQAYRKLGDCRGRAKFGAWVRRIAINICLRRFARETPVGEIDELLDIAPCDQNPVEREVLRRAEISEILDALASLPPTYRTVIVLRYGEELDLQEIADILGEKPGAVYTRLHRARRMLAERLEELSHELR
jgi:RNA polymerase sigma-70 factor (ECF subfamily)